MSKETSKETIELVHKTHGDVIDYGELLPDGITMRYRVLSNGATYDYSDGVKHIVKAPPTELQRFNADTGPEMARVRQEKKQKAIEQQLIMHGGSVEGGIGNIAHARITVASDPDAGHAGVSSAEWVVKHGGFNAGNDTITVKQGENSITASAAVLARFLQGKAGE